MTKTLIVYLLRLSHQVVFRLLEALVGSLAIDVDLKIFNLVWNVLVHIGTEVACLSHTWA